MLNLISLDSEIPINFGGHWLTHLHSGITPVELMDLFQFTLAQLETESAPLSSDVI